MILRVISAELFNELDVLFHGLLLGHALVLKEKNLRAIASVCVCMCIVFSEVLGSIHIDTFACETIPCAMRPTWHGQSF